MGFKITSDEDWDELLDGENSVPLNWDRLCFDSLHKEKAEISKRYNIRFGQTEIYCARCGRPCTPGNHTCGDVRVKRWREAKKKVKQTPKVVTPLSYPDSIELTSPGAL